MNTIPNPNLHQKNKSQVYNPNHIKYGQGEYIAEAYVQYVGTSHVHRVPVSVEPCMTCIEVRIF